MRKLLFFILTLALAPLQTALAETLTLTTYYPAPFGAYDRLRLVPRDPAGMVCNAASLGTLFVENVTNTLKICSDPGNPDYQLLTGIWTQIGDSIFPFYTAARPNTRVGIGTMNPQARLDVDGFTYIGPRKPEESLWFSPGLIVNGDIHVGAIRKTPSVEPAGYGPQLIFAGGPSVESNLESINTDYIWMARYNVAKDVSEFRINIGDNPLADNIYRDSLAIGAFNLDMPFAPLAIDGTLYPVNSWAPRFRMTSDGRLGINTADALPRTALELGDDGAILARGKYASGWIEPNLGAGTRMLWYPRKAAFRAGTVSGTQWNQANIGVVSFATGFDTIASGEGSTAMGYETIASGFYSTAMGEISKASGPRSTAMGYMTIASGDFSTAMGHDAVAGGQSSTAMGGHTSASGDFSTAMGSHSVASGLRSTALGNTSTAQAVDSVVIGRYNIISGNKTAWVDTDPLFVIGNGTNNAVRSNALTVLKNGKTGIGTDVPQGTLEVSSTTGAFIPPRMTTAQRNSLPRVEGSIIYNKDTGKLNFYDGVNSLWTEL